MGLIVGIAVFLLMAGIVVLGVSRRRSDKNLGKAMVGGALLVLVLAQLAVSAG